MLFQENENDSSSEEELERKRKPKKKGRIPALPSRTVVIKNVDKDVGNWMESWSKPKNRNAGHLPHPFRLLALGGVGRGKTNSCKNIFLRHQSSGRKFKRLIIVTCDADSKEWLDCDPEMVCETIPDLSMFDGKVKTLVVIDDYEFEKVGKEEQKKLSTLMRFISSHRNVSVMVSYQSFFEVPPICRKTANCFMVYKPNSKSETTVIENRVGLESGTLRKLFANECNGTYDHIFVDHTINSPYPLRKNIYEILNVGDYE